MKIKLPLLFLACLMAFSPALMAQGKISGKVFDRKSGQAVEYATIAILNPNDSSLVTGSVTEAKGSFSVKVPYGNYLLRVSFMGYTTYYHPSTLAVTAKQPAINVGKISISPSAVMMDEVVVTAERTMVEYQLDKRVVNVDKNLVAGGGTATDVLENVPSVSVDNDGNVTLRGSTNVKVLINGRPYELMGNDLETLLEQIPASSVETVEVITNPSAKYDPEGMSGIINIKLKEKTSGALGLNGVVSINGGTPLPFIIPDAMPKFIPTSMGSINLNYTTEKYNLFLSADGGVRSRSSFGHSNIERLRADTAWSHDTLDRYGIFRHYMGSVKVGGEYYFNNKSSLLVSYQLRGGQRERLNTINSLDLFNDGYLNYDQNDTNINRSINHSFNLSYIKKFDEKDRELTVDATYSTRHMTGTGWQEQLYQGEAIWDNYYLRETETENFHKTFNFKANYAHPFAENWKLETGIESNLDWPNQKAEYFRTEYDTAHTLYKFRDDQSCTHFDYTQQTHAAYATVGGHLTQKLSAQAGLRVEYSYLLGYDLDHPGSDSVYKSYWQPYPTLHLSYQIDSFQSVQLSYSRRVQRPRMRTLNPYMEIREGQELSFGNPNLDPEFTHAFELSHSIGFHNWNIYTCAYFRQTNNKMTRYGFVWDSVNSKYYSWWMPYNDEYYGYWASTWQNLNREYNFGLELIVDWQILKWWKLNASVNLYKSTIEGTELLGNQDKSAFQASGKFTSFMVLPKDWTIQFSGQYNAPWLDLQTTMFASFWFDMAVKKDVLHKRGSVNLRIGDIFATGGWGHETHTEQLNRLMQMRRLSPTVTLGFTYKINNGLRQRQRSNDYDDGSDGDY